MRNKMIIKGASITVVVNDLANLKKLHDIATRQGINVRQIEVASFDEYPSVFEISGSFIDVSIATEILTGLNHEKQWLFVRAIGSQDSIAVCSSQEEFQAMVDTRYYAKYEYKFSVIKNIDLMTISDEFKLENRFTEELIEIFNSEGGWKPVQKVIYWSE